MRKKVNPSLILMSVISVFFLLVFLTDAVAAKTSPTLNNGKKWRIGYYEGGPWPDYQETLIETMKSLADLGWIKKFELPALQNTDDAEILWSWLSHNVKSSYLDFVEDAFWSSSWEDGLREKNRRECLDYLCDKKIDLILALGTWAGLDLANNSHSVPTIVMSTSDPITAGIIKSAENSGFDHVIAECDPTRYRRQIRLFHDIIRFARLGIIYEDTTDGRAYSNLEDLRIVAKERGFELHECIAPDMNISEDEAVRAYVACAEKLAPDIDAFYFAAHRGADPENISIPLAVLSRYNVRTWSNWGITHVRNGVLLSVGRENFKLPGRFYAESIVQIFNGVKPGDLNQVLKEELTLAINLETARRIGYNPPVNLMKITGIVYDKIETP
ncbi:MAG: ABC transporter substrate-binding protein [Desulfobacterales bacterium]|nr:ABC transporter substrate-binding protein [Desulfobacterales bacterium]